MPDRDDTLEEVYRLAKENNRMLRAMRRSAFFGTLLRIAIWVLILGSSVWAYSVFVAPVIEQMKAVMDEAQSANASVKAQFGEFRELLDKFPGF